MARRKSRLASAVGQRVKLAARKEKQRDISTPSIDRRFCFLYLSNPLPVPDASNASDHDGLYFDSEIVPSESGRIELERLDRNETVFLVHRAAGASGFAVDLEAQGVGFGNELGHQSCGGAAVLVAWMGCEHAEVWEGSQSCSV